MRPQRVGSDSIWRSPAAAVTTWVVGIALSALAAVLAERAGQPPYYVGAIVTNLVVSLSAGLVAWRRRPENPTGRQLTAIGFLESVSLIALYSAVGPVVAIGHVIAGSSQLVLAYVLLAYPWGRLGKRFDRWAIVAYTVVFFGIGTWSVVATGTCPYCAGSNQGSTTSWLQTVEASAAAVVVAVVIVRIFWRYFAASPPARRILTPVLFGGFITVLAVAWRELGAQHTYTPVVLSVSNAASALIPIGLLVGFLRLRLRRASVGALAADLMLSGAVRDQLQDVLAKRLGDPRLVVAFWSHEVEAYVDRDGLPLDLSRVNTTRTVSMLDRDGKPDLAIVCDAALAEDPGLLDEVGAVVRLAVANISAQLPAGFVTFLSTDIVQSTELLGRLRERYGSILSEHRQLLRRAVARQRGYVIDSRADELFAVFTQPAAAVRAAVEAQRELAREPWSSQLGVKVRMGIHSGQPDFLEGAYVGLDVHHAIRVSAAARGRQILISEPAMRALGELSEAGLALRSFGEHQLKGFPAPEALYELVWEGGASDTDPGLVATPGAGRLG